MRNLSPYSHDPGWADVGPTMWSAVEISVAILGACAITYRPLFRWILKNWILKIQSSSSRLVGKLSRAGFNKSSVGKSGSEVTLNVGAGAKMHTLGVPQPSVPPSIYRPPQRSGRMDRFSQIDESMNIWQIAHVLLKARWIFTRRYIVLLVFSRICGILIAP